MIISLENSICHTIEIEGSETDGDVPLIAESWTQKIEGNVEFWAKKIEFFKDW